MKLWFSGGKRKEKVNFSEPYLCKFTLDQMNFITGHAEILGSKAAVIRQALKHYEKYIQSK